jgi:hypothetical protein
MNEDLLLADRLSLLVDVPAAGDWGDVERRVRRARRHRMVTTAAIVAAALIVAVPAAFGLHRVVVDFLSAEPAPERVRLDFARLGLGAPKGMAPGVIAGQTRKVPVRSADGSETYVWVAPTQRGGFCLTWANGTGGCHARTGGGVGASFSGSGDKNGVTIRQVAGATTRTEAERLELRFADGTTLELPITWVSPPIDAGFYAYEIPTGRKPQELALYADGGDVLARESFPDPDPLVTEDPATGLPKAVVYERRHEILTIRTEHGRQITLYSAPSRLHTRGWDGRCFWLSARGGPVDRAFYGCGHPAPGAPPLAAGIHGGGSPVLFAGAVGEHVASVELHFQDGDVIELPAAEGWVLGEIPSRHYAPGTRLTRAIARDAAGAEVGRQNFDPTSRGSYPCAPADEIDLGLGVTTCP